MPSSAPCNVLAPEWQSHFLMSTCGRVQCTLICSLQSGTEAQAWAGPKCKPLAGWDPYARAITPCRELPLNHQPASRIGAPYLGEQQYSTNPTERIKRLEKACLPLHRATLLCKIWWIPKYILPCFFNRSCEVLSEAEANLITFWITNSQHNQCKQNIYFLLHGKLGCHRFLSECLFAQ